MSMEVEEDPSSQFVDFTNATALEHFISDLEQVLIAWRLSNKGHASPLTASVAPASSSSPNTQPLTWTRIVTFEPSGKGATALNCALTLFAPAPSTHGSPNAAAAASEESDAPKSKTKWQEGLEHFTPTMLSIAESERDFSWHEGQSRAAPVVMTDDDEELAFDRQRVLQNVQKWFGVDEFLFLSPTSQQSTKLAASAPNSSGTTISRTARPTIAALEASGDAQGADGHGKLAKQDTLNENDVLFDLSVDQNESTLLLSALSIALSNCNCTMPAFVPVLDPARGTWLGSAIPGATGNVSMTFETDFVPELHPNQSCISGLLDFFKLKLQLSPQVEESCRVATGDSSELATGMAVSAAFGYSWRLAEDSREAVAATEKDPLDWRSFDSTSNEKPHHLTTQSRITKMLFGAQRSAYVGSSSTPLLGMDLCVIWPNLREGTYVDNVVHSTLDPKTAPDWMLEAHFLDMSSPNPRKPQLPLSKVIANLVHAYSRSKELGKDLLVSELAPSVSSSSASVVSSSLSSLANESTLAAYTHSSRLPESIPAARAAAVLGSAIGSLTSTLVSAATWKGTDVEEIRRIIVELFDSEEYEVQTPSQTLMGSHQGIPFENPSVTHCAPVGQLVSILACRMGQLQGIHSMSLLWVEFVKALREQSFQQRLLPFMSLQTDDSVEGYAASKSLDTLFLLDSDSFQLPPPDFHQCLLHQKLQLLNCCILKQAKSSRAADIQADSGKKDLSGETATQSAMADLTSFTLEDDDNSVAEKQDSDGPASDDEFFDSIEQQENPSPGSVSPVSTGTPEGILRVIPGVYCLKTNALMMEPITQMAVPLTEDVVKQQQELLSRLGATEESALLRQKIQSTALVSDMQAFKAANPGSCLADFVRWYSPKDWIAQTAEQQQDLPISGKDIWWFENQGMLSDRMRVGRLNSKHLWEQMWDTCVAMPVSRQKCLFDPMDESEKLYNYLETMSPNEMFHQMLAGAIGSMELSLETAFPFPIKELPILQDGMTELLALSTRAITALDEALAESEVVFPTGKHQKEAQERAKGQIQVAFEMALDACWKVVAQVETMEGLLSNALALLHYFPPVGAIRSQSIALVNHLLGPTNATSASPSPSLAELLKMEQFRTRIVELVLENPLATGPVQREYILRCVCPRPYLREYDGHTNGASDCEEDQVEASEAADRFTVATAGMEESPLVVNRMYAGFKKHTVRFALVLAESEF